MKFFSAALAWASILATQNVLAEKTLFSSSLDSCMTNNAFSATSFNVVVEPAVNQIAFQMDGVSTINGNVTIELVVYAYGLKVYTLTLDPCKMNLGGFCPMTESDITMPLSNIPVPDNALSHLPSVAYTIPDIDAKVQAYFHLVTTGEKVACVEVELSNGKTVDQKAVAWTIAIISGLGLIASAITSGLGHSNTAAHVAANALALFGYFQAQAFIGMTAVPLPPIVSSWTQNFQWSMGIIRVGFLQDIATWYQRSTGGTASQILSDGSKTVQLEKRNIERGLELTRHAMMNIHDYIAKRATTSSGTSSSIVLHGIQRVGAKAGIEPTNIFMTGYIFFLIFVVFVVLGVVIFKLICEALVKMGRMKGDKFIDFRNGWTTVLKGILFRIVLIAFPQMVVLCFWEFTRDDSNAIMVLAVFTVFSLIGILAWASLKVVRLARRSIVMHKNPAYILYSDPVALNKWGFLYVQFKATAYWFVTVTLLYVLVKGLFVGLGQSSGTVQGLALFVIEAVYLVVVCVLRPYMDVKTNTFNIVICVVNMVSALILLFFTGIFGVPPLGIGVLGVVFFVLNVIFSTIVLLLVLVVSIMAIVSKNPETRYQPMRDDRGSFIKSQTQLNPELDALGATARGENYHGYYGEKGLRAEDDRDSWSGNSMNISQANTAYTGRGMGDRSKNLVDVSTNVSDGSSTRRTPVAFAASRDHSRANSRASNHHVPPRTQTTSPWQRGAGYE